MSSHDITIAGYLAFSLGVALNMLAHRRVSRIPTVGQVFSRLMHIRAGRIAVIAWWAFIGFHLFSK